MTLASIASVSVAGGFHDGDWVESKDQDPNGTIRLIQLADIGDGYFRNRSDRWINHETFERLNCSPVLPNDVLIARMPDPLGRACLVPVDVGPAVTAVDVAVLRCDTRRSDRRYIMYAINSAPARSSMQSFQDGATRQRIPRKRLGRTQIPIPALSEQRRVADYLDRETTRIDELIDEQQRLIDMLRERRAAVITNAATRGLGACSLVDSGNTFLASVPRGWTVSRFGREIEVNGSLVDPRVSPWVDMTLVAPNHIESGTGRLLGRESAREQGADSGKYVARAGQILYSKIRPALNKVAMAAEDCLTSADMYAMSSRADDDHRYLMYFMLARPFHAFATLASSRVKMPKINREELREAPFLRPPIEEQRSIVQYLDGQTAKIDVLISEAKGFIELARERRAALITSAVTGQIDVRKMV